jgi:hypothetical protein
MSSDTLLREVDEELRRDRMRKLWRQTGPWIIGAAVGIVLVVAGYEGWTWWQKSQSSQLSDQFYAATDLADGTDVEGAKKALDAMIAQGGSGYAALAQFREAALLAQNGKTDEAVAAYDALAGSLGNTHLRELALILAGDLLIDKGDVAAVQQRVQGSLIPSSPMRNAAREEVGLVQYKAGQLDDALENFQAILNDPLSSQDLRNRIQIYVIQLLAEGARPKAPATDATDTPSEAPSVAPADASSAVDASTELDATPPVEASAASAASSAPGASSSAP